MKTVSKGERILGEGGKPSPLQGERDYIQKPSGKKRKREISGRRVGEMSSALRFR